LVLRIAGLDALVQSHRALQRQEIALVLAHVNDQPLSPIRRSGFEAVLGVENTVPTAPAAFAEVLAAPGP
jgi:anti-anti-sigma regulatory factor